MFTTKAISLNVCLEWSWTLNCCFVVKISRIEPVFASVIAAGSRTANKQHCVRNLISKDARATLSGAAAALRDQYPVYIIRLFGYWAYGRQLVLPLAVSATSLNLGCGNLRTASDCFTTTQQYWLDVLHSCQRVC